MGSPNTVDGLDTNPNAEARPDVMNDTAYDHVKSKQTGMEELDTCRICRGEASQDEPLFHPCKCSGSIKFVHQNCLAEWLSHSQKKHCELCKTPFRFTKLYHPQMPSTVPLPVFIRQAAVNLWKTLLVWARFLLVLFVWVAWLPWCMRTIWRGLFWIGDGGWANWTERKLQDVAMPLNILSDITDDSTNLSQENRLALKYATKEAVASSLVSQASNNVSRLFSSFKQILSLQQRQPLGLRLLRRLFRYPAPENSNVTSLGQLNITNATTAIGVNPRSSTWLSGVPILSNMTRSTTVNKIVIDTLEGQIITLLVVIGFILVFLIREWVVQQQPNLNGAAALDAEAAGAPDAEVPVQRQIPGPRQQEGEGRLAAEGNDVQMQRPRARMIARARPRRPHGPRQISEQDANPDEAHAREDMGARDLQSGPSDAPLSQQPPTAGASSDAKSGDPPSILPQRPTMPDRDVLAKAAEVRRILEEQFRMSGSNESRVNVFQELWNRAGQKPHRLIQLIEEEGRNDELYWLVAAMRKIEALCYPGDYAESTQPHSSSDAPIAGNGSGPRHDNGSLPVDTEEFVLLEKPWLSPISEADRAKSEPQTTTDKTESLSPGAELNIELSTAVSAKPQLSDSHANETHRDLSRNQSKEHEVRTMSEQLKLDAAEGDPGAIDNPFHPEFIGELPESSDFPGATQPNADDSKSSEADQPENVSFESIDDQGHVDLTTQSIEPQRSFFEIVSDWLWGGVVAPPPPTEQLGTDDEHVVNDLANEAPFVPVNNGHPLPNAANRDEGPERDPEVVAAAIRAGVDPNEAEAFDDIEDLEGILELVGMQGPVAGLIQNGMFCAVLVSLTIFFAVWIPYISGKLFLVVLTNPTSILLKIPLRWAASSADMIIDLFTFLAGVLVYWIDTMTSSLCIPLGWLIPSLNGFTQNKAVAVTAKAYAEGALERLAKTSISVGDILARTDYPTVSVIAHESLRVVEAQTSWFLRTTYDYSMKCLNTLFNSPSFGEGLAAVSVTFAGIGKYATRLLIGRLYSMASLAPMIFQFNPLRVDLNIPKRIGSLDYDLAYWDSKDRALAIIFGYLLFAVLGIMYLNASSWIRGTDKAGRVNGGVADGLYQAGGVMKVILIISIEMIAFPLYCGLLLDVALLPLFGNATLMSRVIFTLSSPYTSVFVHWFVGTCYMFHFALFVAMCRNILRKGTLYFIRDPDDPTFHPVRDVLERSVSTQLWKISFSALVYGGLVIICLGGVVWGIAFTFNDILPIRWSSNEPMLEFPVDLLFYNFLMPLAVKFFKPSKGLSKMYNWWFRKCARVLRLTNFLFGEHQEDEEGTHLHRSWPSILNRTKNDVQISVDSKQNSIQASDPKTGFVKDGRYVRAPASDQVRIPKGAKTFLDVDERNLRLDGEPDQDEGLHGRKNEMFTKVYIPPFFRLRISVFIFLIWLFAAFTGVSMTIIPLIFGRFILTRLSPSRLRLNDIYAFSVGIYIIGGALYGILYLHRKRNYLKNVFVLHTTSTTKFLRKMVLISARVIRLVYAYAAFGILLPALFSLLMEFYLIIPLHTYFSTTSSTLSSIVPERHIIHLIQDWTLGVLYLKMVVRLILYNAPSRPASALQGIVRNGWLDPDVRLASRGFILPSILFISLALTAPLALGWLANQTVLRAYSTTNEVFEACVYRYSYPGVLALGFALSFLWISTKAFSEWRRRVRDEVYLIGERLHNYGESKRAKVSGKGKGKASA